MSTKTKTTKFYVVRYDNGSFRCHTKSWSMPAMYARLGDAKRYAKKRWGKDKDTYEGTVFEVDLSNANMTAVAGKEITNE